MINDIIFSVVSNKAGNKHKIAWTITLGGESQTNVLSREFGSEEAAQQYIAENEESLKKAIRERFSKIKININEAKEEETVVETVETPVAGEKVEAVEISEAVVEETVEVVEEQQAESTEEVTEEDIEEEVVVETNEEEIPENNDVTDLVVVSMEQVEEETETEEDEEKVIMVAKKKRIAKRILALVLAFVLGGTLGYCSNKSKDKNPTNPTNPTDPTTSTTPTNPTTPTEPTNPGEEIEEGLTTEKFETITANIIKVLQDNNINVTTEEVTKFVSIVNIDRLVTENPELAQELFKNDTIEQYLRDADNVSVRIIMHNAQVFENEKSTENFIRISELLEGESKQQLQIIESYADRIAEVYQDAEKVNALVTELSVRLLVEDLQNLDYGVQYGMQVSIEVIRSYMVKDLLTEETVKVLETLTSLDVTPIMNIYNQVNGLSGKAKTLQ